MVFTLFGAIISSGAVMAQGEENLPIKEANEEVVVPDSIANADGSEESIDAYLGNIEIDRESPIPQKEKNILIIPAKPVPNPSAQEDKSKAKEVKPESSFNIFYYLVYKFRSKEGSGDL